MKLEVGKVYLTRGGAKARVLSVDGPTKATAVVVQYMSNGIPSTRYDNGAMRGEGAEHSHDLVKEYREPKIIYVNEYGGNAANGLYNEGYIYDSEEVALRSASKQATRKGVKYMEVLE